jgi:signal peptidase I
LHLHPRPTAPDTTTELGAPVERITGAIPQETPLDRQEDPRPARGRRTRRLVVLALAVVVTWAVVAGPYVVQYSSMEPTLGHGEIMLVDRMTPRIAGYDRGDVVIFQPPQGDGLFVKRIVGLPGEEVILARAGVFVNGRLVPEPYLCGGQPSSRPQAMQIPEDTYLMLGDNRPESLDSRSFGSVPTDMIVGRVWAGYQPDGGLTLFPPGASIGRPACVN